MRLPDIKEFYYKANLAISVLLILSLFLPYFFYVKGVDKEKLPFQLNSFPLHYTGLTGNRCSSTGLTRSIKSLYNGFFDLSLEFNLSGLSFFLLLITQLLLRLMVFNLKSHLIPWADMLQLLVSIFLVGKILSLNH